MNAATYRPVDWSYYHVGMNATTYRPVDQPYYHVGMNATAYRPVDRSYYHVWMKAREGRKNISSPSGMYDMIILISLELWGVIEPDCRRTVPLSNYGMYNERYWGSRSNQSPALLVPVEERTVQYGRVRYNFSFPYLQHTSSPPQAESRW